MIVEILTHPVTWAIIGILAKSFAPAFIPFLGASKRLVEELTELHGKSPIDNDTIKQQAAELGLKAAQKWIEHKLS